VAIKYNLGITDAFWNSKQSSFPAHVFHLMTSWALVAQVSYLEPQQKRDNESSAQFAARVKEMIAQCVSEIVEISVFADCWSQGSWPAKCALGRLLQIFPTKSRRAVTLSSLFSSHSVPFHSQSINRGANKCSRVNCSSDSTWMRL
jgi:hypothetical protein